MEVIIAAIIGVIVGIFARTVHHASSGHRKILGTIRMADAKPDEAPYLFLELDVSVEEVLNKPHVTFRVDNRPFYGTE